jgi:protein gp37
MANWWDKTWSPTTGCTPVSPGCAHCWAKRMANRLKGRYGYPVDDPFAATPHPDRLAKPLHWRKPRRIAVNLMGDLFHEAIPSEFIAAVFGVMAACPQHKFMVLTKQAQRALRWFEWAARQWPDPWRVGDIYPAECLMTHSEIHGVDFPNRVVAHGDWPFPNVSFGVTVEDQKRADERIPSLLQIPAAVRFLSVEPMLGELDVRCWLTAPYSPHSQPGPSPTGEEDSLSNSLDQVICGGESGPKARPMHPAWVLSLRDQCAATQTPFLFKQWGEWAPWHTTSLKDGMERCVDSTKRRVNVAFDGRTGGNPHVPGEYTMYRLGKHAAGRELDGRIHDEYPGGG